MGAAPQRAAAAPARSPGCSCAGRPVGRPLPRPRTSPATRDYRETYHQNQDRAQIIHTMAEMTFFSHVLTDRQ